MVIMGQKRTTRGKRPGSSGRETRAGVLARLRAEMDARQAAAPAPNPGPLPDDVRLKYQIVYLRRCAVLIRMGAATDEWDGYLRPEVVAALDEWAGVVRREFEGEQARIHAMVPTNRLERHKVREERRKAEGDLAKRVGWWFDRIDAARVAVDPKAAGFPDVRIAVVLEELADAYCVPVEHWSGREEWRSVAWVAGATDLKVGAIRQRLRRGGKAGDGLLKAQKVRGHWQIDAHSVYRCPGWEDHRGRILSALRAESPTERDSRATERASCSA